MKVLGKAWQRPCGRSLVALAVLSALQPAGAQQAADRVERIEVTGTRIAPSSSDVDSPSPIAIISAKDIKLEGYQNLELILNNYPQLVPDQGNRLSNGAKGTATANLRGLGPGRTLVLVNGKRMPAGSPFILSPDLNQIPPQLIQRVEVFTGGASAVYGSDAIAGVVNFILNDRFEGVQGDVSYDFYSHQQKNAVAQNMLTASGYPIPGDKWMDGDSGSANLTLGMNFPQGKGNAAVSFRYFKSRALLQSERDYSACPIGFPLGSTTPACGGSGANATGTFTDLAFWPADPTIEPAPIGPMLTLDPVTGQIRRRTRADLYNFAPANYYQRPQERYGLNALASYEVHPNAKVYAEFGYHDDQSIAQVAPSSIFFFPATVRYDNPLLSADWRSRFVFRNPDGTIGTGPGTVANVRISRRNVDGGPRQDDLEHASFRELLGVKGTVGSWDYDFFFQAARVSYREQYLHDFSNTRIARALDVVPNPATGAPVCASFLSGVDRNCVPWNVWSLNAVTPAALAYVEVAPTQRASLTQTILGGTATTNLGDYGIRVPHTRDAVEVAFGFERRKEKLEFRAGPEFLDLAGFGTPLHDLSGGFTVKDLFAELRVPAFDAVNITGSFRYSDYDSGFRTNTFGVGFNTAPFKGVRLRGSYQRAVRAPDLIELFQPQTPGGYDLGDSLDPCAGSAPARSLAECERTGVTASQYGRIVQAQEDGFPTTDGGNPGLKAETARTFTAGIILAPFKDFSATVDYYDIRIEDTISRIDGGTIFNQCIDTGDPFFCGLVRRDASGGLWYGTANVTAIYQNIGKARIAGVDTGVSYVVRLPKGNTVHVDGLGTYLTKSSIEPYQGAPTVDCAGQFGSSCNSFGMPMPRWRHRLRATWRTPWDFELAATWRYIGSTTIAPPVPDLPVTATLPPMNYLDLAGSWSITKQVTLRGGVANVTDRDPPLVIGVPPGVNGNTYAQLYDALGRHFFVTLTVKF